MRKTLGVLLLILGMATAAIAADPESSRTVGGVNPSQLGFTLASLKFAGGVMPAAAAAIITFFIFQSFLLTYLTDQQFHKWAIRVIIGILIGTSLLGGSVSQALGLKATRMSNTSISGIHSAKIPTTTGAAVEAEASSATSFEVWANLLHDEDGILAGSIGENTAGITRNLDKSTIWLVKNEDLPEDMEETISGINEDAEGSDILSNITMFMNNAVTSPIASIFRAYDSQIVADELRSIGAEVPVPKDGNSASIEDLFAAAEYGASNLNVVVATPSTYLGDNTDHAMFVIDRMQSMDTALAARMGSASANLEAVYSGQPVPSVAAADSSGKNSLIESAKQKGFDAEKEGIFPQYFPRVHHSEYENECQNATSGMRSIEQSIPGMINPCAMINGDPIAKKLFGAISGTPEYLTKLNGMANNLFKSVTDFTQANSAEGFAKSVSSSAKSFSALAKFDYNSYMGSCDSSKFGSFADTTAYFDKMIKDQEEQGQTYLKNCAQVGKSISAISDAMQDVQRTNDDVVDKMLSGKSATNIERESVYAYVIENDPPNGPGGGSGENLASIESVVRQVTGVMGSIGGVVASVGKQGGAGGSASVRSPSGSEGTIATIQKTVDGLSKTSKKESNSSSELLKSSAAKFKKWNIMGGITDALQAAIMFVFRLIATYVATVPILLIIAQAAMVKWAATLAYAAGMALIPIWGLFSLGKNFVGASAGDESYGQMAFFPIVTVLVSQVALGAQLGASAIAEAEVTTFITTILGTMMDFGNALISIALSAGNGGLVGDPFGPMMSAMKPFGVISAIMIGPIMIARLLNAGVITSDHAGGAASSLGNQGTSMAKDTNKSISEGSGKMVGAAGNAMFGKGAEGASTGASSGSQASGGKTAQGGLKGARSLAAR